MKRNQGIVSIMQKKITGPAVCWVALAAVAGCSQQLMPTPNLFAHSETNPFAEVPPALQTSDVDVLFVTDRAETKDKKGKPQFGFGRSNSLSYGSYVVGIGKDVSWSDLVRESRTQSRRIQLPFSRREIRVLGCFPATPPKRSLVNGVVIDDPVDAGQAAAARAGFCKEIARRIAQYPSQKEAFIFIHGFNNSMDDAAFVISDLWHFAGRRGVPIAYTWPAGKGYAYDRESGEFTIYHLKQFLRTLASCPELEKVHIIAHSRGTDVLLTALRELNIEYTAAGKQARSELKLGNVILAAADIDLDVATQRIGAERLYFLPERMTLYVSDSDRALGAASWLFDSRHRLGDARDKDLSAAQQKMLENVQQVQVINAKIGGGGIGHDYFHSNPAVSSDVILILRDNRPAGEKNGRPLTRGAGGFWEIRDDYLLPKKK